MPNDETRSPGYPDLFDRQIGNLTGLPDVTNTRPTTIRTLLPLLGSAQTYIVQTYRQREQGDTIFIECVSADGSFRLALPPKVTDAIARQRDTLTGAVRSKAARAAAQDRKDRGITPGFMKNRPAGRRPRKSKPEAK